MAKAKQSRSEAPTEDLLHRIQELETRLAAVEAGLEAEAALFAVSPRPPADLLGVRAGGLDGGLTPQGPSNGFPGVNGSGAAHAAGGVNGANGHAPTGADGASVPSGGVDVGGARGDGRVDGEGAPSEDEVLRDLKVGSSLPDEHDDHEGVEGVDPEAVAEAAARRKQPDSPIPFSPGDLRSRLGKPGGVMFTGAARLPRNVRAAWQREVPMVDLLDADWAAEAEQVAALAHPVRLRLLREVLKGARSVSALASLPGLGTSGQLYHHLKPLLAEGWLQPAGRGRYEVPNDRVLPLLGIIAAVRRP